MAIKYAYALSLLSVLAGCTLGPDFVSPENASPSSWFRAPASNQPSQAVELQPTNANWWAALNDPLLNELVARVAAENLDVQTATARLEESRAQRGITAADLYPQINGTASYMNQKLSDKGEISLISGGGAGVAAAASGGASAGGTNSGAAAGIPSMTKTPAFNVYQYGFDASWEIDLWGRVRRGVEAADASVQASEEARRDAELSSIAELVRDYVQLRGTQASLATTRENLAAARELLALANARARAGLSSEVDVVQANAQAQTTEAQIPQFEQQQVMLMNAIALLLGQPPGALEAQLNPPNIIPPLPLQVPIGLPSELTKRRPDVRQAEAQLHVATAEIGVAKANFFPQLNLMGSGMLQSLEFNTLNTWAAHAYNVGPSINLPIFEGGRLVSTLELRKASQREAALQYKKTVLNAFHEVDNALTAFRAEQQRRLSLEVAVAQNQEALRLATERYRQGLGDFINVLTSEQNLLAAQQQAITSAQNASINMVQLYKALGGGWEIDFPQTDQAAIN